MQTTNGTSPSELVPVQWLKPRHAAALITGLFVLSGRYKRRRTGPLVSKSTVSYYIKQSRLKSNRKRGRDLRVRGDSVIAFVVERLEQTYKRQREEAAERERIEGMLAGLPPAMQAKLRARLTRPRRR